MGRVPGVKETIQRLEKKLREPLPGLWAQLKMVTDPRPGNKVYHEVEDTSIKAGVLVLLYPSGNNLYLVLTRRTSRVDIHQAQISFPGGRQEEGESPEQTALREAHEEIHVSPDSIQILGKLTPLYIPPSNYCIYPIVAITNERPDFKPSMHEVDEVIEVPLDHLLDAKNIHKEMWVIRGIETMVPFYKFREHKIWGATSMVLAEFLEVFE